MSGFWIILGALLLLIIVVGILLFFKTQNSFREQKNFERGLKMVTYRLHLPPLSDDTEVGSRDVRDVNNESISKAEILYEIISSTIKKGFKNKIYGQRHFGFEIAGSKGFVDYYVTIPVVLTEVVQQAIVTAYPSARIEEVEDYNIFSPVGKITGTMGGELTLKESFVFPIATYSEIKRDPMGAILNSLSSLDKEDGAGIQILVRPADPAWQKFAVTESGKKRKGDKKKSGGELTLWWIKQIFTAAWKPPEDKGGEPAKKEEGSAVDMSLAESIEEKAKHPGYEVLIRVVASSSVSTRAQNIVHSIVASFALFQAQGKNGFKYAPAKDIDSFVTGYIMRFFPPENNKNILNSVELATIFHFPDQKNMPTTQVQRQESKQVDGPRNMSDKGLVLGYNVFRGSKKRIVLDPEDRRRHMYVVGQTGVGKSVFLENSAVQDMLNGDGFAFIDPHGDSAERLLSLVPKERTEDVIYFCPADMEYPLGLNLFEFYTEEQKDFLIQESLNMLYKLYDPQRQGIIGPRFERIFTNCALLLMADPKGGTFVDVPKLLIDPEFMKEKLQYVNDQNVLDFWTKEWPNSQRSNEAGEVISWVVSKFGAFLSNEMMRNIIGQTKSSFNLRDIMDNKKILLVNLSKGRTGELNSKLLGMIFVMKFQAAAMSRANIEEDDRKDFCLYVDEFQNFSTDSFATILSEARIYRLNLIVANQFTTQLSEEIRDAVFGNIGTVTAFRTGTNDAEFLAKYFAPVFDLNDLQRTPNWNAIVRMLVRGVPTQAFSMSALAPLGTENKKLMVALKQLSAAKHGRPRLKVEAEIFERLKTNDAAPTASAGPTNVSTRPPAKPAAPKSGSSFLDDWLSKRQAPFTPPATGFGKTSSASPQPAAISSQPAALSQQSAPSSQPPVVGQSQVSDSNPQQQQTESPQPPAVGSQPKAESSQLQVESPLQLSTESQAPASSAELSVKDSIPVELPTVAEKLAEVEAKAEEPVTEKSHTTNDDEEGSFDIRAHHNK